MRSKTERGKISIGLVGAGPVWDQRYRQVVTGLSDRIVVAAVFDSVLSRAQHVAAELNAEAVGGLTALFERSSVQGVLILDPAWFGAFPLRLGFRFNKPVFLAESPRCELELLQSLERESQDTGATIMVEFARRHEPATNRLRELMATRLGPARRIEIDVPARSLQGASGTELFTGCSQLEPWLDWSGYVAGWSPQQIQVGRFSCESAADNPRETRTVTVTFGRKGASQQQATAVLRLQPEPHVPLRRTVDCDHGHAELLGEDRIAWQNGAAAGDEHLGSEKTAAEVTLQQFCRRIAGGLVPVAGLSDVARGLRLAAAVRASEQQGTAVSIEP